MNDELVTEFLAEARDHMDRMDRDLVALEHEPASRSLIASIFRSLHSIKGTAVCLGFSQLGWIAHNGENVLGRLRDGELALDASLAGLLLETADAIRFKLGEIENGRREGEDIHATLVSRLDNLARSPGQVARAFAVDDFAALGPRPLRDDEPTQIHRDASLRVDVRIIEKAMRLATDLCSGIARVSEDVPPKYRAEVDRLGTLASDLSESLRRTRMQPVGNLWISFPRVVRDLALACGKKVQLETEGARVELDRSLLEAIKDPLIHLLRNAVDHGIELPGERLAASKDETGRVTLSARRGGRYVYVSVSDDGSGVDVERVKRRARDRGLLTLEQARELADSEVHDLLFLPGFSTTEQVTQVSGRGVGLDVVKTNVEQAGGRVEVTSTRGAGTTISLRFGDTVGSYATGETRVLARRRRGDKAG